MRTTLPRHSIDTHPESSGQLSVGTILRQQEVPGATEAMRAVLWADSPQHRRLRTLGIATSGRTPGHLRPFRGDDDTATVKFPAIVLTAAAEL